MLRRGLQAVLLCWVAASAQTPPTGALVRGVLLERDAYAESGELSVRAADNEVFRYRFDRKTYVERESEMIDVARLAPGERIEIVSDRFPGASLRYAMTIHVLPAAAPRRPAEAGRRSQIPALDDRISFGAVSFSGLVTRLSDKRFVLHTREKGDQTILLRADTRYVKNGEIVDAAALKLNSLVFVRAGKTLYDELEAYQVIWGGSILQPKE